MGVLQILTRSTAAGVAGVEGAGPARRIKRVQVAHPGTSFNPDPEQHQEVLATAVAHEVGKGLERELGVKERGQLAPAAALAASSIQEGMDELAMLQVHFAPYPGSQCSMRSVCSLLLMEL